ncbi:uncharacterized protein N7483_001522 [Penicillium malachiteum]|uniref:uncharacterized protein n=1 Tax=Penicillium malachiteum TaxID=1324776 RepID=UPI0025472D19|nr:uncharacterized protein N7483_001522 [Penicillium malachiteum]KAJ5736397.1 hypothetical protein N7483_001522 [Penicillium malachiteum]
MSFGKKVALNTGTEIPQLGFGTWQSAPGQVGEAVYEALKAGYRHLDFATIYQNQREVATGIKRAYQDVPGLKREDLFITSKLWNSQHRPEDVEASLDACLAELELDYLDLYLVHWPVAFKQGPNYFPLVEGSTVEGGDVSIDDDVSIVDTWKAMIQLPKTKARAVGVSNHMVPHLEAIIKATGVVPAANQIERHPVLQSNELIKYCQEKGIHITAYSAFGNNGFNVPLLITRPEVLEVAESVAKRTGNKVTGAHVILAWSQVGGHSVIPKSVTPSRIQDNFNEIELTAEEVAKVSALGQDRRRYNTPFIANTPRWNVDIFGEADEKPAGHQVIL